MCFIMKIATLFETKIKTKKNTSRVRIQSITMVTTYIEFNTQKKNRSRKNQGKDGGAKRCTN